MIKIRYPNITGATTEERQKQMERFIRSMVDQLNLSAQTNGSAEETNSIAPGTPSPSINSAIKKVNEDVDKKLAELKKAVDQEISEIKGDWEAIYPIGSIYISASDHSPEILFGGKWEQIKDRFLLASGDAYSAGATGGEAEHTLTVDEMPSHDHNVSKGENYDNLVIMANAQNLYGRAGNGTGGGDWEWSYGVPEQGGSQPHNNMPPYLAVNIWKRTE